MAPKVSVQNKPGVKKMRGWWYPVVNCWRDGRIIASETMSDKYIEQAAARQAAKKHCETVDTIVRAAMTPVTVVKPQPIDEASADNPMNTTISTTTL